MLCTASLLTVLNTVRFFMEAESCLFKDVTSNASIRGWKIQQKGNVETKVQLHPPKEIKLQKAFGSTHSYTCIAFFYIGICSIVSAMMLHIEPR